MDVLSGFHLVSQWFSYERTYVGFYTLIRFGPKVENMLIEAV